MGADHGQFAAAADRVPAQRAAKERLRPALSSSNAKKSMSAPVVAMLAYDMRFFEHLPRLFHNPQARSWYETTPEHIRTTALRNATLQGAYLMLAARAIGLDCGPMSGFNNDKVDAEFFPDGRLKSNFLCCLGRGDPSHLPHTRGPLRIRRGVPNFMRLPGVSIPRVRLIKCAGIAYLWAKATIRSEEAQSISPSHNSGRMLCSR